MSRLSHAAHATFLTLTLCTPAFSQSPNHDETGQPKITLNSLDDVHRALRGC